MPDHSRRRRQSSRNGPSAFIDLLDERRDQHRDQGVGQPDLVEEAGAAGVHAERDQGRDRRPPGEAEDQVADRLRLVAVEPEEAADQYGHRQDRRAQADGQPGRAVAEAEDEQHRDRAGGDEADHPDQRQPARQPAAATRRGCGRATRRRVRRADDRPGRASAAGSVRAQSGDERRGCGAAVGRPARCDVGHAASVADVARRRRRAARERRTARIKSRAQ